MAEMNFEKKDQAVEQEVLTSTGETEENRGQTDPFWEEKEAGKKEKATILGKSYWILFWLFIPGIISGLMTNEQLVETGTVIYWLGTALDLVLLVIYGVILFKLQDIEPRYRLAGIFTICTPVLALVVNFVPSEHAVWVLLSGLPTIIVGLAAKYYTFSAHAKVMEDFDLEFSQKWRNLLKWYIIMIALTVLSMVVLFVIVLAAILILVAAIGLLVLSIMELVYLYRMAVLLREPA